MIVNFGDQTIAQTGKAQRLNQEITAPQVRLMGEDGQQIGIVPLEHALAAAQESGVDLVEIAPLAQPPVCRLMDFGKFKYHEAKKAHDARLKQKQVQVKEVKFRPGTDEGDYKIKMRNLLRFLGEGDKAKVTLRFRGREMAHQDLGFKVLERIKAELEPYATVEQFPRMEGRQLVMVMSPIKKKSAKDVGRSAGSTETGASAARTG